MNEKIEQWLQEANAMYEAAMQQYTATKEDMVKMEARRVVELTKLNQIGAALGKPAYDVAAVIVPQAPMADAAVNKAPAGNSSRVRRPARTVGKSPMAHDRETPGEKGVGSNGFAADEE